MTNDQVHFSCLQSDTGPSALLLTRLRLPIFAHDNGTEVIRKIYSMLLQATIIRNYFVKTQTSVASFSPPDLSIIFSNGMYLEVSPL